MKGFYIYPLSRFPHGGKARTSEFFHREGRYEAALLPLWGKAGKGVNTTFQG